MHLRHLLRLGRRKGVGQHGEPRCLIRLRQQRLQDARSRVRRAQQLC
jgi:hypothetical protein